MGWNYPCSVEVEQSNRDCSKICCWLKLIETCRHHSEHLLTISLIQTNSNFPDRIKIWNAGIFSSFSHHSIWRGICTPKLTSQTTSKFWIFLLIGWCLTFMTLNISIGDHGWWPSWSLTVWPSRRRWWSGLERCWKVLLSSALPCQPSSQPPPSRRICRPRWHPAAWTSSWRPGAPWSSTSCWPLHPTTSVWGADLDFSRFIFQDWVQWWGANKGVKLSKIVQNMNHRKSHAEIYVKKVNLCSLSLFFALNMDKIDIWVWKTINATNGAKKNKQTRDMVTKY